MLFVFQKNLYAKLSNHMKIRSDFQQEITLCYYIKNLQTYLQLSNY